MSLLELVQNIMAEQYSALNAKGINFGGREPVSMQIYTSTLAGSNPLKRSQAWQAVGQPIGLISIDTVIGQVREWRDGSLQVVGDARLEIARKSAAGDLLSIEQLQGVGLDSGQQLRYFIGQQAYTLAGASVTDEDGTAFRLTLAKVPG